MTTTTSFPLTAKYDREWVGQNSSGENVLHDLESLCEVIEITEGMRVLDLGCGNAVSSIFLAREYGAYVWAVDKYVSPTENSQRIIEFGCGDRVYPLKADARALPFPQGFFDLIISVNAYHRFGTDAFYLPYLAQFMTQDGTIGIVDSCFTREMDSLSEVPAYLKPTFTDFWHHVHSIDWWKHMWGKTGLVNVLVAEPLPQSDFILQEFIDEHTDIEEEKPIIDALQESKGELISLFRMAAQRSDKKILPNFPFNNK